MPADQLATVVSQVLDVVLEDGRRRDLNEPEIRPRAIDPVLAALGYRTLDQLQREVYLPDAGGTVDYLLTAGSRQIIVEAKALNVSLGGREATQLVQYCAPQPVRWALLTNGVDWHVFDTEAGGDWEAQRIAQIDLAAAQRVGRLDDALRALSLFAHDTLAADDAALNAWAVSAQARRHIAALLADPSSWPIQTIVTSLQQQRITIPPAAVVELICTRAPVPPEPRPASAAPDANCYVLPSWTSQGVEGIDILRAWLPSGLWAIGGTARNRRALQKGDQCCFCTAREGIVATAEVAGPADDGIAEAEWRGPTEWTPSYRRLPLQHVRWLPQPIETTPELRRRLDLSHAPLPGGASGLMDLTVNPITEHDFRLLTGGA